ncbi:MAG: fibronectin type III domain-containing protein [Chloroflexi bacterium]|nr:fibronectin type III domain-containing protein [Chloroflexota bacterium]
MRRLFLIFGFLFYFIATGCSSLNPASPQGGAPTLSAADLATVNALSVQSTKTPDGILRFPTPTFVEPLPLVESSSTLVVSSIKITGVSESGPGSATVNWEATGDFPSGFKVVWTDVQGKPTFPENTSVYTSDRNARSAVIIGDSGKIYYVRVCRYINGSCDLYSDLGIFTLIGKHPGMATPLLPTATPLTVSLTKTALSGGTYLGTATPALVIKLMKGGENGKAYMSWSATGSFPLGFKIYYSKTHSTPTLAIDPYFSIREGETRSAYVTGDPGSKYYYRLCRTITAGCDNFSPVFSYKFSGTIPTDIPDPAVITITAISDTSVTGQAEVIWTATGAFPSGFKILYSKTQNPPTLSDSSVYVSDGNLRTGTLNADPSGSYYFRVCKYYNGSCVVYSSVRSFTLAADPATITISSIVNTTTGSATVTWEASGTFADGFEILYSATNASPTESDSKIRVSDGSLRSFTVGGNPNTRYYYRICKWSGSACTLIWSDPFDFRFADAPVDAGFVLKLVTATASQVDVSWTLAVDNPEGYRAIWSLNSPVPWPDSSPSSSVLTSTARTYSTSSLSSKGTYYMKLCKWNGTFCSAYSNTETISVP